MRARLEMAVREPTWWYGTAAVMPRVLAVAGGIYGAVAAHRMQRGPSFRAGIPVVAIGNFTAGGTGKTPFVRVVVAALRAMGHSPAILTRGYGGRTHGPAWVDVNRDTAETVGDEPLLLAADAPVMVARDRASGARAIEASAVPRASVIVMDDGLQNPSLAKDLTFAVVDAKRGLGNGRCIPAGPLRAPLDAQLTRVDALLLNRGDGATAQSPSVTALTRLFDGPVLSALIVQATDLPALRDANVVAYAGIGGPERFFATVAAAGAVVRRTHAFADHFRYDDATAAMLLRSAADEHAILVTTEKDFVRLKGQAGPGAELRAASVMIPIRLQLDVTVTAALAKLLAVHVPLQAGSQPP